MKLRWSWHPPLAPKKVEAEKKTMTQAFLHVQVGVPYQFNDSNGQREGSALYLFFTPLKLSYLLPRFKIHQHPT